MDLSIWSVKGNWIWQKKIDTLFLFDMQNIPSIFRAELDFSKMVQKWSQDTHLVNLEKRYFFRTTYRLHYLFSNSKPSYIIIYSVKIPICLHETFFFIPRKKWAYCGRLTTQIITFYFMYCMYDTIIPKYSLRHYVYIRYVKKKFPHSP